MWAYSPQNRRKEDRTIFASPNVLIRAIVSPLGANEILRENAPTAGKCL